LVLILGLVWYEVHVHPLGGPGKPETIKVASGESYSAVTLDLAKHGVISDGLALKIFDLIHGSPTVLPGYYTLHRNSTYQAAHDILAGGPNTVSIYVPSGFTLSEIAGRVSDWTSKSFSRSFDRTVQQGTVRSPFEPASSKDLEGLVAPGSYLVTPNSTGEGLLRTMVHRFVVMAASAGLSPSSTRGSLDAYQLVTAASVVEKEGYLSRNMGKVATVIFNRLDANMPLQMDATVLYALGQDGGPVTHATESYPSPYNSYLHHGLPPTPICSPSRAALEATMSPTPGPWLYFTVVDKSGTEAFSTTFAEQLANEQLATKNGL
jgi:UPF0755 protein